MKIFNKLLGLLTLVLVVVSCSGIKVVDSWKADEISSLSGAKILVIARSDDMVGRQRFEQEIAERLRGAGVDAMESYKKFPAMKHPWPEPRPDSIFLPAREVHPDTCGWLRVRKKDRRHNRG